MERGGGFMGGGITDPGGIEAVGGFDNVETEGATIQRGRNFYLVRQASQCFHPGIDIGGGEDLAGGGALITQNLSRVARGTTCGKEKGHEERQRNARNGMKYTSNCSVLLD